MEDKIKELFELRKIPNLLKYFDKEDRKWLYSKLVRIQSRIYDLDHYLETNWELKEKKLNKLWSKIYGEFRILNISTEETEKMTAHIRKYQLHEAQLREGKLPTRLKMEYYYYYKSCDVRLMRQLLYTLNDEIDNEYTLADWRYFDLITEFYDDIEDVYEDQKSINGNYFMISIKQIGIGKTYKLFSEELNNYKNKAKNRFNRSNKKGKAQILKWTIKSAQETQALLDKRKKKIAKKPIKKEPLLFKLITD